MTYVRLNPTTEMANTIRMIRKLKQGDRIINVAFDSGRVGQLGVVREVAASPSALDPYTIDYDDGGVGMGRDEHYDLYVDPWPGNSYAIKYRGL